MKKVLLCLLLYTDICYSTGVHQETSMMLADGKTTVANNIETNCKLLSCLGLEQGMVTRKTKCLHVPTVRIATQNGSVLLSVHQKVLNTNNQWIEAGKLQIDDSIRSNSNIDIRVEEIELLGKKNCIQYTVEPHHIYPVGDMGIIAHNDVLVCGGCFIASAAVHYVFGDYFCPHCQKEKEEE